MDNILRSWAYPKRFRSVNIHFVDDGFQLRSCVVSIRKQELVLESTASFSSLQEFGEVEEKLPSLVILTGRKILNKSIDLNQDESVILRAAFPAAKESQVYYQSVNFNQEWHISVVRREVIDSLLAEWPKEQPLLDTQIGFDYLIPFLNDLSDKDLPLGDYRFSRKQSRIIEGRLKESTDFLGEPIDDVFGAAFANALHFGSRLSWEKDYEDLRANRLDWQFSGYTKRAIKYGLAGSFILLIASFLMFSHFSKRNSELALLLQGYEQQSKQLESMERQLDLKKSLISLNNNTGIYASQVLDQASEVLTSDVSFSRFQIHPVERIKEKQGKIFYNNDLVVITGKTNNYEGFRLWLLELKTHHWVKGLDILGYQETSKIHKAEFSLQIKLREDG
ncbi:MAG: hypothetical protein NXI09_15690 [Bacteroidetes bacterium]|nr:hypothetical protein [Bacteroidota bacterium]